MEHKNKILNTIKKHYEIGVIILTGLFIRIYMALLDPFLHNWDERYHALVAKNMIRYPFKPMIFVKPINHYEIENWCCNHIWLHKQPLFLWQMALSMKVFGVSEFTMRLPSVILGSLSIWLIYRIAWLATENKLTSCLAALLLCFSHYQLQLISGRKGMDHNDIAFSFYILSSFWAYFEYLKSPKWYWIVLIGIFSGCAILNKWLTALLVFLIWGIKILLTKTPFRKLQIIHFSVSLLTCIVIFLPWQLFILHQYPVEAQLEYALNSKHLTEAIEGHKGDYFYYIDHFDNYFGQTNSYLVVPGALLMLFRHSKKRIYSLSMVGTATIILIFFTFCVKTKVTSFFFIAAPFCMIFISVALNELFALIRYNKLIICGIVGFVLFRSLDPFEIIESSQKNNERESKINNTMIYKKLDSIIPANIDIVMNVNEFEFPDVMFYSNRLSAIHYCLSEKDMEPFVRNKIPIAAFKDHSNYSLPDHIKRYDQLFIIEETLK